MAASKLKVISSPFPDILHPQWFTTQIPMPPATAAYTEMSDESLVAETLDNAECYGVLMARYEAPIDRYIRRLGIRTPEDRQDVLQEVFIKAYRNLRGFDQSLKFSSWLYRIAHNEAISWYRKHSVRPEGHLVEDSETILQFVTEAAIKTDAVAAERLNAEALSRALDTVPEKYRTVLMLRYFEHKEYEEISDILRVPVGTVGTLLHRGKARLEKALSAQQIDV